jgi:hypothetical protein
MNLHACQNCWFNGLQYGDIGPARGYCVRHRKILNLPDRTTCGLHLRKDLTLRRAEETAKVHEKYYAGDLVSRIADNKAYDSDVSSEPDDLSQLKEDAVADAVTDYGELGSTIESLAQLKVMPGARAELAMLSLGRGYVNNCVVRNGGTWTSGLHLYWWSRRRLTDIPDIRINDLRSTGATSLKRQSELSAWSLIMLRVTFIEDMTIYAEQQGDSFGTVSSLTEQAALALDSFNLRKLIKWLKTVAGPQLDKQLPRDRYYTLAKELHSARELPAAGGVHSQG